MGASLFGVAVADWMAMTLDVDLGASAGSGDLTAEVHAARSRTKQIGSRACIARRVQPRVGTQTLQRTPNDRARCCRGDVIAQAEHQSSDWRLDLDDAPVAQWIEQLTSEYPGRCAVAPSVSGGA